ncbi:MAG TPA: hypothetical protein VE172_17370 [Stackebrandtia sp.]|uniref:hypothetical protein n=1 Tax=Stackebrandtia sp. TaxID=2023065 RepID=UPI002D5BC153|nr:hypothetical protein [Stackebrandtia sp.]HZE40575.1 hypothetical protein [Stackebrandtia sp.]
MKLLYKFEAKEDGRESVIKDQEDYLASMGNSGGTLKQRFVKVLDPEPDKFDPVIQTYDTIIQSLGGSGFDENDWHSDGSASPTVSDSMNDVINTIIGGQAGGGLPGWNGKAAHSFRYNFANAYALDTSKGRNTETLLAQRWFVNTLKLAAGAHKAIHETARKDANKFLDSAINAANAQDDWCPHFGENLAATITILTAVSGIADGLGIESIPLKGIAAIGEAATGAAEGTKLEKFFKPSGDNPDVAVDDSGAYSIYTSALSFISTLGSTITTKEKDVKSVIHHNVAQVTGAAAWKLITGPAVTFDGKSPTHTDANGTTTVDKNYLDNFDKPYH